MTSRKKLAEKSCNPSDGAVESGMALVPTGWSAEAWAGELRRRASLAGVRPTIKEGLMRRAERVEATAVAPPTGPSIVPNPGDR